MRGDRISWIDVARGIGILLVVYAHSLNSHGYRYIIYAFHMPLFFFLSGIVFHHRKHEEFRTFLIKNVRNILLPYILFALLSFLIWPALEKLSMPELMYQFSSIFYGNGNNGLLAFNNILWFLPCLFLVRLLFFGITKLSVKTNFLIAVLLAFSLVGYGYSIVFPHLKLIFGLETALTGIVFFGAGYLWNIHGQKILALERKQAVVISAALFLFCFIFATAHFREVGYQVDLRMDRLGNYGYLYLSAFSGIFGAIFASLAIKSNRVLEYLGRHTLVIFAWHLLVFSYLSQLLVLVFGKGVFAVSFRVIYPIFYSVFAISVILLVRQLIVYHFGKRMLWKRVT